MGKSLGYWDFLRNGQSATLRNKSGVAETVRNTGGQLLIFSIPRIEIHVPGTTLVTNSGFGN